MATAKDAKNKTPSKEEVAKVGDGEAILIAPDNCTSCSFDDVVYDVDADGFVIVPNEAVADLTSHGFTTP